MIGTSTTINQALRDVYYSIGAEPRYFIGTDQASTFRERIQEMYADNREITEGVAELDEYFSDPAFADHPEVRRFTGWVARSIENPRTGNEIAGEIVNQGYIMALKRFGYRDAPLNVAFSRDFAKEHDTCFAGAFMFGPGGAARIAFADWLVEEKLHGMYRPGKAPGSSFSKQTRKIWYEAEHKNKHWPQVETGDGESIPVEVSAEQGKLPEGMEQVLRDSWLRSMYHGKDYAYTGMRPLRCGQNFQMIEDMVGVLFEADGRSKMYRSPLNRAQQLRYDRIIEDANRNGIEPFYAVYNNMFSRPDALRPVWNKARRILYGYSTVLREAAIDAGLIEEPAGAGITWHQRRKAWQAQIAFKGKQKYLGIFKSKADARAAYSKAAAKMGHIPGLPDIDKIWPTWEQQKDRLAQIREYPRMPIIYQQQDTHQERKSGLRPPEALRGLVERMKSIGWLVKHCLLAFDYNWPAASQDIAVKSRGRRWCQEIKKRGKRFVIQGCALVDKDAGRIRITIYRPGFGDERVLAEEIYHIVFGMIRKADPTTHRAMQRWYQSRLKNGADPTVCMDEAFSKSMALEESGVTTSLPRRLVQRAQWMFSPAGKIPASVMDTVKASWSMP